MSVYQIYRLQNLCRYLPWSNNCKLFDEKQLLFLSKKTIKRYMFKSKDFFKNLFLPTLFKQLSEKRRFC